MFGAMIGPLDQDICNAQGVATAVQSGGSAARTTDTLVRPTACSTDAA